MTCKTILHCNLLFLWQESILKACQEYMLFLGVEDTVYVTIGNKSDTSLFRTWRWLWYSGEENDYKMQTRIIKKKGLISRIIWIRKKKLTRLKNSWAAWNKTCTDRLDNPKKVFKNKSKSPLITKLKQNVDHGCKLIFLHWSYLTWCLPTSNF